MDCRINIIHSTDLTWALLATIGGLYPLLRLLEHLHTQSGRDLFALIFTFVTYPWAMATMHLVPFDKGLVYAICIFSVPLYGIAVLRLIRTESLLLQNYRKIGFSIAAVLAMTALSNPWHGQFALFDVPLAGQPNHMLDYQAPRLGATLTLIFAVVTVLGTALMACVRLLRSRFVLSYSLLGVLLPTAALFAYINSSMWKTLEQWQINPFFLTTTLALFYFSYLTVRGKVGQTLPVAHNQIISLMPDAIVMVDAAGNVTDCNPAFGQLTGTSPTAALAQPLAALLPDTTFLQDPSIDRHLLTIKNQSNDRHLDLHITPLTGSEPGDNGKMILVRDVTDQTSAYHQLKASEERLHQANDELARLSTTDALTGLRNRRYFQQQLEHELERYHRGGATFGLISLDLDHFKNINDCHGHQTGDAVLTQTARILENQCRAVDTLARVGGEEFMVLVVDCDQAHLEATAERLRKAVEEHEVAAQKSLVLSVTTSLGATLVHPEDSLRAIMHRVDDLLYCAKHQGRNRSISV